MRVLFLIFFFSVAHAANVVEWHTNRQIPVTFIQSHEVPMFDVALVFKAGSRYASPGLANFTGQSTLLGSKFQNKEQVNAKLNHSGSELNTIINPNSLIFSVRSLADTSVETVNELFNSAVFTSVFPSQEIRSQRASIISDITFDQTQPEAIAQQALYKLLFPSSPKFYSPINGYADTLENFHTSDLQIFHNKMLAQPGTSILIIGDLSEEKAKSIANNLSKKLPPLTTSLKEERLDKDNTPQTISINPNQPQTYFTFATKLPIGEDTKDFVALLLLNELMGGNTSSFLYQTLRDQQGVVYDIHSDLTAIDDFSLFSISGQSDSKDTALIGIIIDKAFNAATSTEVLTEKRFNVAKKSLSNKLKLNKSSNSKKLHQLIYLSEHNLTTKHNEWLIQTLDSLNIKDVEKVLKNFKPNQFYKVYVGS